MPTEQQREQQMEAARALQAALKEYLACVYLATHPANAQADVITLAEIQKRLTGARDAAEAALALAKAAGIETEK